MSNVGPNKLRACDLAWLKEWERWRQMKIKNVAHRLGIHPNTVRNYTKKIRKGIL
jgi:uncharacterized protein YjcR